MQSLRRTLAQFLWLLHQSSVLPGAGASAIYVEGRGWGEGWYDTLIPYLIGDSTVGEIVLLNLHTESPHYTMQVIGSFLDEHLEQGDQWSVLIV